MIDVVFLLLIFFMVTANFAASEQRLRASVASDGQAGTPRELEPQIVRVVSGASPDRATFLLGANAVDSRAGLAALLKGLPKEPGVVVRVADDAPVWAAAAALQAATDAGFEVKTYAPEPLP